MNLAYKIENVIIIDGDDFNNFIQDYYGQEYDIKAVLETRDSTCDIGTILKDTENTDLEHPDITKFKNGKDVWIHPSDFIEDLVNKDELPSGKYFISI